MHACRDSEMNKGYVRTNITLPLRLLKIIDHLVEMGLYQSRSDFIKEAMREHINNRFPYFFDPNKTPITEA